MSKRKLPVGSVLTGDIVNSTKLAPEQEKALIRGLRKVLGKFFSEHIYEFYRGDSFQVYMKDPAGALRMALACRCLAIEVSGRSEDEVSALSDVRISIGIGKVKAPVRSLGLAKGEAFLLSGRQFDQLKERGKRMVIGCGNPIADAGFEVMADYLDSIYEKMTVKQAGVIVELLRGVTQQQLTVKSNKSKSTISELASAGRWPEIERILVQYEKLVNLILWPMPISG